MAMPGSTGIELKAHSVGKMAGHPGTHPSDMNAMTKGCLAGTAVCFISHQGEVYPCGYLPALAGDLRKQSFADIWQNSVVFNRLRDTNNLKGKCGCCEFRNIAWVAARVLSLPPAIIWIRTALRLRTWREKIHPAKRSSAARSQELAERGGAHEPTRSFA